MLPYPRYNHDSQRRGFFQVRPVPLLARAGMGFAPADLAMGSPERIHGRQDDQRPDGFSADRLQPPMGLRRTLAGERVRRHGDKAEGPVRHGRQPGARESIPRSADDPRCPYTRAKPDSSIRRNVANKTCCRARCKHAARNCGLGKSRRTTRTRLSCDGLDTGRRSASSDSMPRYHEERVSRAPAVSTRKRQENPLRWQALSENHEQNLLAPSGNVVQSL